MIKKLSINLHFFGSKQIISLSAPSYYAKLTLWDLDQCSTFEINLLDHVRKNLEEGEYEYAQTSLLVDPVLQLLGYIIIGATYGIDGIRVLSLNFLNKPNYVFELDEFDQTTGFCISSNSINHKFLVLRYSLDSENIAIWEYSMQKEKEINIYHTDISSDLIYAIQVQYLSERDIAIIDQERIILLNLDRLDEKRVVELDRANAYSISGEKLYYVQEGQIQAMDLRG